MALSARPRRSVPPHTRSRIVRQRASFIADVCRFAITIVAICIARFAKSAIGVTSTIRKHNSNMQSSIVVVFTRFQYVDYVDLHRLCRFR